MWLFSAVPSLQRTSIIIQKSYGDHITCSGIGFFFLLLIIGSKVRVLVGAPFFCPDSGKHGSAARLPRCRFRGCRDGLSAGIPERNLQMFGQLFRIRRKFRMAPMTENRYPAAVAPDQIQFVRHVIDRVLSRPWTTRLSSSCSAPISWKGVKDSSVETSSPRGFRGVR